MSSFLWCLFACYSFTLPSLVFGFHSFGFHLWIICPFASLDFDIYILGLYFFVIRLFGVLFLVVCAFHVLVLVLSMFFYLVFIPLVLVEFCLICAGLQNGKSISNTKWTRYIKGIIAGLKTRFWGSFYLSQSRWVFVRKVTFVWKYCFF